MSTAQLHATHRVRRVPAPHNAEPTVCVCHVSLTLATGGLERILADFATHRDRTRFRHEFIAVSKLGTFADRIRRQGCPVYQLQSRTRAGRVWEMRRLFVRRGVDIVHTHNLYPHVYGTLAARLASVPVVINTRHGQRYRHGRKSSWLFRAAAYWTDQVVGVSEDAAQLTVQHDRVTAKRVRRIWNGIDTEQFRYAGPRSVRTAIAVSRLSSEKDLETLLQAFALAGSVISDLRLKIVGDGPLRSQLEALATQLNISHRVQFLGDCSDVASTLETASVFVTATKSEGLSLTLLEAMATGLPVVATRVGGNAEVVQNGRTGILVPAGDARAIANAVVEVCKLPDAGRAWGRAGRARVEQEFDIRRTVRDYERLYYQLSRPSDVR